MAQTTLTVRVDEEIKKEAEILFEKMGLNMSSAVNVFFRQAIREQSIPFILRPYEKADLQQRVDDIKNGVNTSFHDLIEIEG